MATIISSLGELHHEIYVGRAKREHRITANRPEVEAGGRRGAVCAGHQAHRAGVTPICWLPSNGDVDILSALRPSFGSTTRATGESGRTASSLAMSTVSMAISSSTPPRAPLPFQWETAFLTTASGLVSLALGDIHASAYFHPNDLLQLLSLMPQLELLGIAFSFPCSQS
ncbi:hypothetical protein BJV74DRAFT_952846 [Russula compacta]|nr:hypothetical protein BJV74DRAFT_952846 [Russula compacta]